MVEDSKHERSQDRWDVIVIGSGMGDLSAAAALSRTGHKVLVLEQYQTLGGLTHSFSRNGFNWDAGIHYLSGVAPGKPERMDRNFELRRSTSREALGEMGC